MPLITPNQLKEIFPISEQMRNTVDEGRSAVRSILRGDDKRVLAVVGPCSIHDIESAKDYALRLKELSDRLNDKLFIVMRVYLEKPRTSIGWKGFLNDPYLNNSCSIEDGLKLSRELLSFIAELGLPAGGELLNPATPLYFHDLYSWSAIGARTSESQSHRDMAGGLDTVVGFKNSTDGNVEIAINALLSASSPRKYIGITTEGKASVINTTGNRDTHIVLRGGKIPNYSSRHIREYEDRLSQLGLPQRIMVDCSHGNSSKSAMNQTEVLDSVSKQINEGNTSIFGFMLESNINTGRQEIPADISKLKYGVSVTDECLGWESTEKLLTKFHNDYHPSK
jgi:3-deoxy-7-phosphoheptulonate synthase